MNEPKTIEGLWSVPKDHRSYGILKFDPEAGLELSVKITDRNLFAVASSDQSTTIFGQDEHGQPVSLFGCAQVLERSSSGLLEITISPTFALLGRHIRSWAEAKFTKISAQLTLLHDWMGQRRISFQGGFTESPVVEITSQKALEAQLNANAKMIIVPAIGYTHHFSGLNLTEGHRVEFNFSAPQAADRLLTNHVYSFRRLLTLFTGTPVFVEQVYFDPPQDNRLQNPLAFLQSNAGYLAARRGLHHENMVVSFQQISDRWESVMQTWFSLEQQLNDALNLYFATILSPSLFSHQHFLFLAQALEVYHRTNPQFVGNVQDESAFRARIKQITAAVPGEAKWLNEKLAFANEKSFAQRLTELVDKHSVVVPRFIASPTNFVSVVKNTRNHFTHYATDARRMTKVAKDIDLLKLTGQMQTLLEIRILTDLGITGAPIDHLIQRFLARKYFNLESSAPIHKAGNTIERITNKDDFHEGKEVPFSG